MAWLGPPCHSGLLLGALCALTLMCCAQFDKYGVVSPSDPFLFPGKRLKLDCNITNTSVRENSSLLYFARSTDTDESVIPDEKYRILTTKSMRMTLENIGIDDGGNYLCMQRVYGQQDRLIGHQVVKVDYPPQKVTNLTCRVHNWVSMNCTWDLGVKYRHLKDNINVTLVYATVGKQSQCPQPTKTSCVWPEGVYQHGHVFRVKVIVKTTVTSRSALTGKKSTKVLASAASQVFNVQTQLYVEPDPVQSLQVLEVNSTCLQLSWRHTERTRDMYFVCQQSSHWPGEEQWKDVLPYPVKTTLGWQLTVCDLVPNTTYFFRVSVLPFPADTEVLVKHGHRSDWTSVSGTTEDDVPGSPPVTCPSCYQDLSCLGDRCRKVRIYWKAVPKIQHHGTLMSYHLTVKDGVNILSTLDNMSPSVTSAELYLPDAHVTYEITLQAVNRKGPSQPSVMLIPATSLDGTAYLQPPSRFLVETDKSDSGDVEFYLSWVAAEDRKNLSNITIFWCENDLQQLCQGDIHWMNLPRDKVTHMLSGLTIKSPRIGIAAEKLNNGNRVSSGIFWASCIYGRNLKPDLPPAKVQIAKPHSDALTVRWAQPVCRPGKSHVIGYKITFCQLDKDATERCRGQEEIRNVNSSVWQITLTDLKPDTSYRVTVAAESSVGLGPASAPVQEVTASDMPEPSKVGLVLAVVITVALSVLMLIIYLCVRCVRNHKKNIPECHNIVSTSLEASNPGSDRWKNSQKTESSSSEDSCTSERQNLVTNSKVCPVASKRPAPAFFPKSFASNNSTKNSYNVIKNNTNDGNSFSKGNSNNGKDFNAKVPQVHRLLSSDPDYDSVGSDEEEPHSVSEYQLIASSQLVSDSPVMHGTASSLQSQNTRLQNMNNFSYQSTLPLRPFPPKEISLSQAELPSTFVGSESIRSTATLPVNMDNCPSSGPTAMTTVPGVPEYVTSTLLTADTAAQMPHHRPAHYPESSRNPPHFHPSGLHSDIPSRTSDKPLNEISTSKPPDVLSGYVLKFPDSPTDLNTVTNGKIVPKDTLTNSVSERDKETTLRQMCQSGPVFDHSRNSLPLEAVLCQLPPPPASPPPPEDVAPPIPPLPPAQISPPQRDNQQVHSSYTAHIGANECDLMFPVNKEKWSAGYLPHEKVFSSVPDDPPQILVNGYVREQSRPHDSEFEPLQHNSGYRTMPEVNNHFPPVNVQQQTLLSLPGTAGGHGHHEDNLMDTRPLSGDLLNLPDVYYKDPNMSGSDEPMTEL